MKKGLQKSEKLAKRMLAYAGSAGALAVLATNASAEIIYSGPQDVVVSPGETFPLDMDGDGNIDFVFIQSGFYGTSYTSYFGVIVNANPGSYSNSWMVAPSPFFTMSYPMVDGLSAAADVNSAQSNWSNLTAPSWAGVLGVYFTSELAGDFVGETKFIGVRFYIGTEQHYGWIRASMAPNSSSMVIHDWAYESVAGTGIVTDGEGPVATLTPDVPARTNIQDVTVNITFDEEAAGLDISDFIITNGTAGTLTEITPGLEYSLTVTSGVHGMVTVTLPAGVVTDTYGNENIEYVSTWFYDDKVPTLSLTDQYGGPTNIATQEVSIVFSEEVLGFTLGDVIVTNGSAANLTEVVPNQEYTVDVTAAADGQVTVEVPAAAVVDYGNNPNDVTSINWMYDTTPPIVALDVPEALTADSMQVVSISFNEEVDGFELTDLAVTNGSAANLVEVTPGMEYTVEITASSNGEVLVQVPLAVVVDPAGNENEANEISWLYDSVAPEVTLESGATGSTDVKMVTLTITANETILDLALEDLVVTNGTAANLTEVTPGTEYTVEITASAAGDVSVELPAAAVTDEAGNANALTSTSWTYDDAIPTVQLEAGSALTNEALITVTVSFSEEITGLELTDFNITNGTASNLVEVTAGLEYTVDVTATAEGTVEVELLADAVQDATSNGNASISISWEYDQTAPAVTVDAGNGTTVSDETVTISIDFDEEVRGLELTDISVTNGTASNLVEVTDGQSYTVDITATAEGEVTVEVSAGAVSDAAGNENAVASDSYIYEIIDGIDNLLSNDIRVYPNPSEGILNVELEHASTIRILTASGKLVLARDNITRDILDLGDLSQGVYILQVENAEGISNKQFVIK